MNAVTTSRAIDGLGRVSDNGLMFFRLVCCLGVLCAVSPAGGGEPAGYRPLIHRQDVWHGSTYWAGPDWTRVGRDWHHPGVDTASVRRFTVPRDGQVSVSGRVYKADVNRGGGDGVRLSIRQGRRTVWKAEIDGNDGKGVEPRLTLTVRQSEAIRFVVHKRGRIFYDTTHWDPVVTYADGEQFRASEGFSTSEQGQGGWFYEMEVAAGAVLPPPFHSLGLDLPAMVEAEWRWEDKVDGSAEAYAAAAAGHLEKTRRLLEDLRAGQAGDFLAAEAGELRQLAAEAKRSVPGQEQLYLRVRRLKRRIALANPLMNFGKLVFC